MPCLWPPGSTATARDSPRGKRARANRPRTRPQLQPSLRPIIGRDLDPIGSRISWGRLACRLESESLLAEIRIAGDPEAFHSRRSSAVVLDESCRAPEDLGRSAYRRGCTPSLACPFLGNAS